MENKYLIVYVKEEKIYDKINEEYIYFNRYENKVIESKEEHITEKLYEEIQSDYSMGYSNIINIIPLKKDI